MDATNKHLAGILSDINTSRSGTLVCVTVRKKGVERGRGSKKQLYDNDLVKVLLWTGFSYDDLMERSQKKFLHQWENTDKFITKLAQEVKDAGFSDVTIQDASEAASETNHSLSLQKEVDEEFRDFTPTIPQKDIWKPLIVKGVKVKGAKVYSGNGDPSNPKAPVPGDIYLDGIKLGEVVLEEAPHWQTKKKAKTKAKEILRSRLPIGLYSRYCLGKNSYNLTVGPEASKDAKLSGIDIDPDALRELFRIA